MGNYSQLTHLLRLLDDDSSVVQEGLAQAFFAYGPGLLTDLCGLDAPPDSAALERITDLVYVERRNALQRAWEPWLANDKGASGLARMEEALSLIAAFQGDLNGQEPLSTMLDALAEDFRLRGGTVDEATLARFLFTERGLAGDRSNYYDPQNSNLAYVIASKKGLPISLACVYMLVGHRFGFNIGGCNWPNHFYARAVLQHKLVLIDCFNGGRMMDRDSFLALQGPSRSAAGAIVDKAATVDMIVSRVLGNLVRAYGHASQEEDAGLMLALLQALEGRSGVPGQA